MPRRLAWATAPRVAFVAVALLLAFVWLRFHSWEVYMYASSVEGFFRLSDMFQAVKGGQDLPEVSHYHPYHPLLHMVVGALARLLSPLGADALLLAVLLNKLAALFALPCAFLVLHALTQDRTAALVGTAFLFSTKAFLFGAFSGEAHMVSLAFLFGALALVVRTTDGQHEARIGLLGGALFSVGTAMNLAVFFYGLAPLLILLVARRTRAAAAALAVSFVLLFLMYIVFPVLFFGIKTSHEYFRLFSIYADLPKSVPPLGTQLRDFAGALSSGLVGGVSVVASLVRICSLVLLVAGAVAWAKAPTVPTGPTGLLARVWIAVWIVGFAGGEIAMNTAKSVNGTLYVMLPLAALVALLCSSLRRGAPRAALTALLVVVSAWNLARVVSPKVFVPPGTRPHLQTLSLVPAPQTPVAVVLEHMSLFREVHYLGSRLGVRDLTAFIPHLPESQAQLRTWMGEKRAFCILSSTPLPAIVGVAPLLSTSSTLSPDVYHFSVDHPEAHRDVVKQTYLVCRGARLVPRPATR